MKSRFHKNKLKLELVMYVKIHTTCIVTHRILRKDQTIDCATDTEHMVEHDTCHKQKCKKDSKELRHSNLSAPARESTADQCEDQSTDQSQNNIDDRHAVAKNIAMKMGLSAYRSECFRILAISHHVCIAY